MRFVRISTLFQSLGKTGFYFFHPFLELFLDILLDEWQRNNKLFDALLHFRFPIYINENSTDKFLIFRSEDAFSVELPENPDQNKHVDDTKSCEINRGSELVKFGFNSFNGAVEMTEDGRFSLIVHVCKNTGG